LVEEAAVRGLAGAVAAGAVAGAEAAGGFVVVVAEVEAAADLAGPVGGATGGLEGRLVVVEVAGGVVGAEAEAGAGAVAVVNVPPLVLPTRGDDSSIKVVRSIYVARKGVNKGSRLILAVNHC
jgi:hypothetical protein